MQKELRSGLIVRIFMSNNLKYNIKKYQILKIIFLEILILSSIAVGRHFFYPDYLNILSGLVLGAIAYVCLYYIEKYTNKRICYEKGLKLESQVADKLNRLGIKNEQNIKAKYGDLDIFVDKNGVYYGFEVKNWSGVITFENGSLVLNNFYNKNSILEKLLKNCKQIKENKFGKESNKFVKPVLVFGYKTCVQIPQNKINFNGVDIIVATIKDFEKFIN